VPTHRSTVGKAPSLLEAGSESSPRPKGARPKLRPSGRTIKYADLGYLSRFGGSATRDLKPAPVGDFGYTRTCE